MASIENRLIFNPDYSSDKDLLGFNSHIDVLSHMICAPEFKTPFCIGIYGQWGSGKTTFMRLLANEVKKCETGQYIIPVWFNPWRYTKEDHLIIPFLKTIQQEINTYAEQNKKFLEKIYDQVKEFATGIGELADAFAFGAKQEIKFSALGLTLGVNIDNAKAIERLEELEKERLEKAKKLADNLSSLYYGIVRNLKEQVKDKPFRIIIFIDDLDRCLPQKAVELLEAVKLFLDLPGYLFVIGVDKEVVKQGIADYYKHLDKDSADKEDKLKHTPDDYLDKMIQLPLDLPHIEHDKRKEYIKTLLNNDRYAEHADIINRGIGDNPRALKRFINLLAFTTNLAESLKDKIRKDKNEEKENKSAIEQYFTPLLYVKWSLIVFKFPKVHGEIKQDWEYLGKLQSFSVDNTEETKDMDDRLIEILKKGAQDTVRGFFPKNKWLIEKFIYLTQSTKIQVAATDASAGYRKQYQAGEPVLIPKGPFLYGDGNNQIEKNIEHDYYMDVFPVTNAQYQDFINENEQHAVPSGSGEKWADWGEQKRTLPEGMENHPVVMVSYADAEAYCKWRSEKEKLEYRLPTEEEWEKAASWDEEKKTKYKYPWGDEFDKDKCNTEESDKNKTTSVGSYPNGVSPYGCQDMVGNVWEWCASWYTQDKSRVLRGGSWFFDRGDARCASRGRGYPENRNYIIGFRCARTKK